MHGCGIIKCMINKGFSVKLFYTGILQKFTQPKKTIHAQTGSLAQQEGKKGGARGALTMGFNPAGGEVGRLVRGASAWSGRGHASAGSTRALESERLDAEESLLVSLARTEGGNAGDLRRGRQAREAAGRRGGERILAVPRRTEANGGGSGEGLWLVGPWQQRASFVRFLIEKKRNRKRREIRGGRCQDPDSMPHRSSM